MTQITLVPSDQSVQGTTQLALLIHMYQDLRHRIAYEADHPYS